jgi:hypothetical protein
MFTQSRFLLSGGLVAILAFLPGCGDKNGKVDGGKGKNSVGMSDEHDHPSEGPHGGHLIELGHEEYHAELVEDERANKITIYLLDSDAKGAVPVDAQDLTINATVGGKPRQFKLPAAPQQGDSAGTASRFELADEELFEAIEHAESKARLAVTINEKQYTGNLAHEEHGEHAKHEDK